MKYQLRHCCNESGQGVAQNYSMAIEWYHKAAMQGVVVAQCNLGVLYNRGRGVEKDYAKAMGWYVKAAAQGNAVAQRHLEILRKQEYNKRA